MSEKGGKLKDIKETASDAVEIMRELGTPGVQETFDKIRDIAVIAKEIMETMKTPEWQQNMENIRMITDNMKSASERTDNTMKELKASGVIDESRDLIKTVKEKINSFGGGEGLESMGLQDLREMTTAFKGMLESVKGLLDELKIVAAESKRSGTLHAVEETIKEASDTYRTIKDDIKRQ